METYTISNLTFSYPETEIPALQDLSLILQQGDFVTLCGKSGCGKTTLLKQLKSVTAPHGERAGTILFEGIPLDELDQKAQSSRIGFVHQSPDNQIVTDKVWHELAFGLESLGLSTPEIRLRVSEIASFFGIQNWFYKNVTELSGGQKQILNLAAIMAMQPSVLILDEPTSQLDPIAAEDFLTAVGKINRELGVTVLMTEHRLEEALPLSDRVLVMDGGRIIADGTPKEAGAELKKLGHSMFLAMPVPMRVYAEIHNELDCPVTVREGRAWLDQLTQIREAGALPPIREFKTDKPPVIEMKEVWFRYEKEADDVVKGLSMKIYPGEFYAIVGGNGAGKTTSLSLISGVNKPHRGSVKVFGRLLKDISDGEKFNGLLGVLPQNPQTLFVEKTVERDLAEIFSGKKLSKEIKKEKIQQVSSLCELDDLLQMHPYDLSGGEQQRAALAKVLLLEPCILLMDEPTKGMDSHFKKKFAGILKKLKYAGATIVIVSHDIEFCAGYADRCAMFFDGSIVTENDPRKFFSGNNFYTTAANRMARRILPEAITAEDIIAAMGGTVTEELPEQELYMDVPLNYLQGLNAEVSPGEEIAAVREKKTLTDTVPGKPILLWRKVSGTVILAVCGMLLFLALKNPDAVAGLAGETPSFGPVSYGLAWKYALGVLGMTAGVISGCILLTYRPEEREPDDLIQVPKGQRKLPNRTIAAAVLILLLIPLTIWVGIYYFGDRKYYFISMLIILETMLPFVMVFEGRKPQARELIVIAVLCAIAVAGRTAFFWAPQFKPVAALVIIAGVALGGETGFLVGAASALISNFFFGQGPWTPWQMFAFGVIGFLAGVLFRKGILRRNILALCIFGGISTFFIYGVIMNTASVFMFQNHFTLPMLITMCLMGIPFDLVHALATVFFLWAAAGPMLEKLDRIKVKYGLVEKSP